MFVFLRFLSIFVCVLRLLWSSFILWFDFLRVSVSTSVVAHDVPLILLMLANVCVSAFVSRLCFCVCISFVFLRLYLVCVSAFVSRLCFCGFFGQNSFFSLMFTSQKDPLTDKL
jgi:hypothetical protein